MMQAWADYLDGLRSAQTSDRPDGPDIANMARVRTLQAADCYGFTATTLPFSQT